MERKNFKIPTAIFITIQILLFPLIQLTPVDVCTIFSYASIILVFVFALFVGYGRRENHFIRLGLVFTLLADYCLVMDGTMYLEGVIFFMGTQMCYFLYLLAGESPRIRKINILSRLIISFILVGVAFCVLGDLTDILSIVSVLYYGNLVINMVFAFAQYKKSPLFAIGLLLFSFCDLCIGLDMLFNYYLELPVAADMFYSDYHNLPWVFYQPSQTLIALSLTRK